MTGKTNGLLIIRSGRRRGILQIVNRKPVDASLIVLTADQRSPAALSPVFPSLPRLPSAERPAPLGGGNLDLRGRPRQPP